jgi:HPr kinase/phosphorylase
MSSATENGAATRGARISVAELLAYPRLSEHLSLVSGEGGVSRPITHPRVQKSGLVFAGHARGIVPTRVQVLGETEYTFLEARTPEDRRRGIEALLSLEPSVVIVTRGAEPFDELVKASVATETPLVVSSERSSKSIHRIHAALDWLLAPRRTMHGVLLDVHGVGLLLTGPSAVGKSECALFLLERGHRLVADDRVELVRLPTDQVEGSSPELLRNHLELRGIGIVNVRDLFGAAAVREKKTVNLIVELCQFDELEDYDRLGLDDPHLDLLGLSIPALRIPVRPGRNMAVILEVAARNHLLKRAGRNAARSFVERLEEELLTGGGGGEEEPR